MDIILQLWTMYKFRIYQMTREPSKFRYPSRCVTVHLLLADRRCLRNNKLCLRMYIWNQCNHYEKPCIFQSLFIKDCYVFSLYRDYEHDLFYVYDLRCFECLCWQNDIRSQVWPKLPSISFTVEWKSLLKENTICFCWVRISNPPSCNV